jgi:hypothetical protein
MGPAVKLSQGRYFDHPSSLEKFDFWVLAGRWWGICVDMVLMEKNIVGNALFWRPSKKIWEIVLLLW